MLTISLAETGAASTIYTIRLCDVGGSGEVLLPWMTWGYWLAWKRREHRFRSQPSWNGGRASSLRSWTSGKKSRQFWQRRGRGD